MGTFMPPSLLTADDTDQAYRVAAATVRLMARE
jgi:hypothetical protein